MDFGIFQENASKPIKLKFRVKQILSYEYRTLARKEEDRGHREVVDEDGEAGAVLGSSMAQAGGRCVQGGRWFCNKKTESAS